MSINSPFYTVQTGNGGQNAISPGCQYIVNVTNNRSDGGQNVCIYQVQDNPVDVRNLDISLVADGSINGTSVQANIPGSSATFTFSTTEP